MEINKIHMTGIIIGALVLISSFFFMGTKVFVFMIGIGILIGILPLVVSIISEAKRNSEKEEMFLEFTRNLVESVKTGTPVSRSIVNVKGKSYGVLGPHVKKLANQISLGIPLREALQIFAKDVNNKVVSRSLTLIGQAEKAGGDIGRILESVTEAVTMSDKLKKERKAAISTLVVQSYIIFFVFILIILVLQFKIIPMISGIADVGVSGMEGTTVGIDQKRVADSFLYLLLIQGLFSGLVTGKLAEGDVKAGVKHSFVLMLMAFLISAGANLIFTG